MACTFGVSFSPIFSSKSFTVDALTLRLIMYFKNIYLCILLAVSGLSCKTKDL